MTFNPALLLIPVVGVAALLLTRKKASAAPIPATAAPSPAGPGVGTSAVIPRPSTPVTSPGWPSPTPAISAAPRDWQAEVAAAVSAKDPVRMRTLAAEMQAAGKHTEAALLLNYATLAERSGQVASSPTSIPRPPQVTIPGIAPTVPSIVPPQAVPPAATQSQPPAIPVPATPVATPASPFPGGSHATLAQTTAQHLSQRTRYMEDRALVKRFQRAEGLVTDGLYGVKTAQALAKYGLIPPKPFYFSRTQAAQQKRDYAGILTQYALRDPARSAQWLGASRVAAQ